MSRRLEWQQVAAQGLNPLGGIGTSIGAFQGAAGTAQALRNSERADDALIQNSYSDLIRSSLAAGQLELQGEQLELQGEKLELDRQIEARTAKGEDSFNPAVAERIFTDHFIAGGTPENFMDNPNVMGLVSQYGDSAFTHGIQTFNRFNTGVEKEATRLTALAESTKAAKLLEIDALDAVESIKNTMKQEVESEYANTVAGIQANAFSNYTSSMHNRSRYLGLEPREATTEGGTPNPVARQTEKSNEFSEYMSQLHTDRLLKGEELEESFSSGLINEAEYTRQKTELDESFNSQLRQLGKDSRRYNITSSTGENLTFDYTELPNGGIQVGNQELPREVSNSLRVAVDSFDVPMEVMLAFAVQESSMNSSATSPTGVKGLMQVTEATGKEMLEKNRELFEFYGITPDNINDRDNPFISAMTGAAYIAHIRDDILHGDAPIEQVYVAYNIGPNNPLVKQFHNKNVPIDQLQGVDVQSSAIQNNLAMYYDKSRDAWRTPAQISALVRDRMKLTPAGEDPVTAISNVAAKEPQESNNQPLVNTVLDEAKATNRFYQIDLHNDPLAGLDRAVSLANSIRPFKALGVEDKLGVQLSAKELGDMLTVMDIEPDADKVEQLRKLVSTHEKLSTMPAEEVSTILSWGVKDTWLGGGGVDEASTLENVNRVLETWDLQREKIRAQMTSAANIKKYADAYTDTRERLQSSISELESSLNRFDNRELTGAEARAREETARRLVMSQRELASATTMYQGRIQEDYEKILRFQEELEKTRMNKPSAEAQKIIEELMKKNRGNTGITREVMEAQMDAIGVGKQNSPLISYMEEITTR